MVTEYKVGQIVYYQGNKPAMVSKKTVSEGKVQYTVRLRSGRKVQVMPEDLKDRLEGSQ